MDAWEFERAIQDAVALRREEFEYGVALYNDELPRVYDANFVRFDRVPDASVISDLADELQASLGHRKVVLPESGAVAADELRSRGWKLNTLVTMAYRGSAPEPSGAERVSAAELREARRQSLEDIQRDADATRQIVAFVERMASSVPTTLFAARPPGVDEIGAFCCLFQRDGVGQIDEVTSVLRHRRQGLGGAVVRAAVSRSLDSGDSLTFLVADEADWPKDWYERLGFEVIGRRYELLRA